MKKLLFISLYCLLTNTTFLFSQRKDSATISEEMDRVNRMVDSMRPLLAARDSESNARWEEIKQKNSRVLEDYKQKEIEQATKEVVQRQEKEQKSKRNTMMLAVSAFLVTLIVARIFFKRKKQN